MELEGTKKAQTALEDKMESEKKKAQQTKEEIQRRNEALESNEQNIRTIENEGKQRQSTMTNISVGDGILSTIGTVSAVAATVLFPPAGVVAAGTFALEYNL